MSKSKFNFKDYVKINGDIPIDARLQDEHGDVPEEVTEKQLDRDRSPANEVTIEKLLENTRTGGAYILPEGRLNTEKSLFGKYRNPEAFKGDINKVEEQRLAGDPVEDEKYTDASETPKKLRWWEEGGKSPDGLKLTHNTKPIKVAEKEWIDGLDEDEDEDEGWVDGDITEMEFDEGSRRDHLSAVPITDVEEEIPDVDLALPESDFRITDMDTEGIGAEEGGVQIVKQRDLSGSSDGIDGIYIKMEYNPKDFGGDEQSIRNAALLKVKEANPYLEGLIKPEDFSMPKEDGEIGTIYLRAMGSEFAPVSVESDFNILEEEPELEPFVLGDELSSVGSSFTEVDFSEDQMGGTGMASGVVKVEGVVDYEHVIEDVLAFLNDKHYGLDLTESSLDLSKLEEGIIGFLVSPQEAKEEVEEEIDFPIEENPLEEKKPLEELKSSVVATASHGLKKK